MLTMLWPSLGRQQQAGVDGFAVEEHGIRAGESLFVAEFELLEAWPAQGTEQAFAGSGVDIETFDVNRQSGVSCCFSCGFLIQYEKTCYSGRERTDQNGDFGCLGDTRVAKGQQCNED